MRRDETGRSGIRQDRPGWDGLCLMGRDGTQRDQIGWDEVGLCETGRDTMGFVSRPVLDAAEDK